MTNELRIAIAGRLRSGKDTFVDLLIDELQNELGSLTQFNESFKVQKFAFGDKLKDYAHEICMDIPREPKPRELYQGMNIFRTFDPEVWVKHLDKDVVESNATLKVITDVRQNNELNYCDNNGFHTIKVVSDTEVRKQRVLDAGETWNEEFEQHPSEIEIDGLNVQTTVVNNDGLEELKSNARIIAQMLVEGYLND